MIYFLLFCDVIGRCIWFSIRLPFTGTQLFLYPYGTYECFWKSVLVLPSTVCMRNRYAAAAAAGFATSMRELAGMALDVCRKHTHRIFERLSFSINPAKSLTHNMFTMVSGASLSETLSLFDIDASSQVQYYAILSENTPSHPPSRLGCNVFECIQVQTVLVSECVV